MTILNINIKEKDKKKIQSLVESNKNKSISDVVRKLLSEKIKIEEFSQEIESSSDIEIPEYIPKNKYVGFVKGAIIAVADTVAEVAQVSAEKFPNGPLVIKFNGQKKKPMEYCFMSLSLDAINEGICLFRKDFFNKYKERMKILKSRGV